MLELLRGYICICGSHGLLPMLPWYHQPDDRGVGVRSMRRRSVVCVNRLHELPGLRGGLIFDNWGNFVHQLQRRLLQHCVWSNLMHFLRSRYVFRRHWVDVGFELR